STLGVASAPEATVLIRENCARWGPRRLCQTGSSVERGGAFLFVHRVALAAETAVPKFDEALEHTAEGASGDGHRPSGNLGPGMDGGADVLARLKYDPLLHGVAQSVVDPGHAFSGRTHGDHMVRGGPHRPDQLDAQAAAHGPWRAAEPANVAVKV